MKTLSKVALPNFTLMPLMLLERTDSSQIMTQLRCQQDGCFLALL